MQSASQPTMNHHDFSAYLRASSTELRNPQASARPVHVVLGNESGDLDSVVCALLYAYYKHTTAAASPVLFVPVLNVPQADLELRKELLHVLQPLAVAWEWLVCLEEFERLSGTQRLHALTLVDHNRLAASQRHLGELVREVVDHHVDETQFLPPLALKLLSPVGSCATLLSLLLLQSPLPLDPPLAQLLLSVILTDTINFNPAALKTTPQDEDAAAKLTALIPASAGAEREYQLQLFLAIEQAKSSVDSFTSEQLLRKDYKEFLLPSSSRSYRLGMASTKISMSAWLIKDPALLAQFAQFCSSKLLDILYVGTEFYDEQGQYNREGVLWVPRDAELFASLHQFLRHSVHALEVTANYALSAPPHSLAVFRLDSSLSRKVLSPLFQSHLQSMA